MFQVFFLELENSGNLNFIVSSLLVLDTPTVEEYLDLDISIALQKYKYLLLIIELLHLVSKRIYIFLTVSWLPFTVHRVVVATL